MTYGNFKGPKAGLEEIKNELVAVQDLLEKGELTDQEAFKQRRKLQRAALLYIVKTNGGYTAPRPSGKDNQRLADWRKKIDTERAHDYISRVLNKDQVAEGAGPEDLPEEAVTPPAQE